MNKKLRNTETEVNKLRKSLVDREKLSKSIVDVYSKPMGNSTNNKHTLSNSEIVASKKTDETTRQY